MVRERDFDDSGTESEEGGSQFVEWHHLKVIGGLYNRLRGAVRYLGKRGKKELIKELLPRLVVFYR